MEEDHDHHHYHHINIIITRNKHHLEFTPRERARARSAIDDPPPAILHPLLSLILYFTNYSESNSSLLKIEETCSVYFPRGSQRSVAIDYDRDH